MDYTKSFRAKSWCNKNGIKIYVVATKKGLFIDIWDNGKVTRSPNIYRNNKDASKKIWELYLYLCEKYKSWYFHLVFFQPRVLFWVFIILIQTTIRNCFKKTLKKHNIQFNFSFYFSEFQSFGNETQLHTNSTKTP